MRDDPYRRLGRGLYLLELMHLLLLPSLVHGVTRLLRRCGARRVLDLCCGTGQLVCRLSRRGYCAVGLDISAGMLTLVRGRSGSCRLLRGDATRPPLRAAAFDAAVVSLSLHEMGEARAGAVWEAVWPLLREGGLLLLFDFTVPRRSTLLTRPAAWAVERVERRMGRIDPGHYRSYRAFLRGGGLGGWLEERGVTPCFSRGYLGGNLMLAAVRAPAGGGRPGEGGVS